MSKRFICSRYHFCQNCSQFVEKQLTNTTTTTKKNAVNMAEQTSDGQDKRSDLMYLQSVFLSFKTLSFSFTPSPRFYYALIIVFLSYNRDEKKTNYY